MRLIEKPYCKSANDLLIHRVAVPLLRWRRLFDKSKFEHSVEFVYKLYHTMVRIATFLLKIDCFFAKKYVKMMMRYFILL